MKLNILSFITFTLLFAFSISSHAQPKVKLSANKSAVIKYIDQRQKDFTTWSDQVWAFAEPPRKEIKSSKLLIDILRAEGFVIQEGVSGIPTCFIATYGTSNPVIGLYGEYDADPKASNKIVPRKEELVKDGYGHGGNHNLLGVGSLGAALAIKDLIERNRLKCTIRYYGTTDEGSLGAKTYLARDGYFNDLDLSLYWHPAPSTWASTRAWDALIDFDIIFSAKKINVIREIPGENNSLSAIELLLQEMRRLRQQMTSGIKINYAIRRWNNDINQIPDTTKLTVRIQCAKQADALALFNETKETVKKISAKTSVNSFVTVRRAMHQFMPNIAAMHIVQQNMELLGPITYTNEEQSYAKELQKFLNVQQDGIQDKILPFADLSKEETLYGYASDIGDASWIAPEIYFTVRTLPPSIPMHQWAGTAFSGYSIGHKGMIQAAKILCLTIIDFVDNESLRKSIRKDFEEKNNSYRYKSLLQ